MKSLVPLLAILIPSTAFAKPAGDNGFCAGPAFVSLAANEKVGSETTATNKRWFFLSQAAWMPKKPQLYFVVLGPMPLKNPVRSQAFTHHGVPMERVVEGKATGYQAKLPDGTLLSFFGTGLRGTDKDRTFFDRVDLAGASEERCKGRKD